MSDHDAVRASESAFVPRFANWRERVETTMSTQGLLAHLDVEMLHLAPGRCVLRAPYSARHSQQNGFFHAGVSAALGDSAGGFAALTLFGAEDDILTVEFKINLIAPAAGDELLATGTVVRNGRQLTVTEVTVDVARAGVRKPCARMLQTLTAIGPRG